MVGNYRKRIIEMIEEIENLEFLEKIYYFIIRNI